MTETLTRTFIEEELDDYKKADMAFSNAVETFYTTDDPRSKIECAEELLLAASTLDEAVTRLHNKAREFYRTAEADYEDTLPDP